MSKKFLRYTIIILSILHISSCGLNTAKYEKPKSKILFEIDIEKANNKIVTLSEIVSKIDYVQLETNKNCIINPKAKYLVTDSLIFINNLYHVLKFSRDGRFLGQISNYGRGPGENEGIGSISIIPKKNLLVIQSSKKILIYSFKGNMINDVKTPAYSNVLFISNTNYLGYFSNGLGYELYNFILTNLHQDTISSVRNYVKWRDNGNLSWWSEYPFFKPFYNNINNYYMKSLYNDTVYSISQNKIVPSYYINLGRYKLPPEWATERIMIQDPSKFEMMLEKQSECYYCSTIESANKIFLTLVNFRTYKPKYFLFDRSMDYRSMLIDEDQTPSRIKNDIDGGMDFWPEGKIDDEHLFMSLNVSDLKKKLDHFENHTTDNKANNNFNKLLLELDITANPVLMIVSLKN